MVAFCTFDFRLPVLKPNTKKKGALIIIIIAMGLLRNLDHEEGFSSASPSI